MKKIVFSLIVFASLVFVNTSCTKLLEVKPEGLVGIDEGIQTSADLEQYLVSSYDVFRNGFVMGGTAATAADVFADEAYALSTGFDWAQIKTLNTNLFNPVGRDIWRQSYLCLQRANVVIDYLDNNRVVVTDIEKKHWKAEAQFIRGICYYHLLQYFSLPYVENTANLQPGVPLRTKAILSNEAAFEKVQRASVNDVYTFLIAELMLAEANLPTTAIAQGRATQDGASAYLAKVYLQMNDMPKAYEYANKVAGSETYYLDPWWGDKYARASLGNASHEVIFGLTSSAMGDNSGSGFINSYRTNKKDAPSFGPTDRLVASLSEYPVDTRAAQIVLKAGDAAVPGVYSTKYNYEFMDAPVICLNEILLIRAEAGLATGQGDPTWDLNQIQARAGVPMTAASAASILAERRKELALQGTYFFDLKRTRSNNIRGQAWNSSKLIFQIPDVEQNGNPSIILN